MRCATFFPSPACGRGWRAAPGEGFVVIYMKKLPKTPPSPVKMTALLSFCLPLPQVGEGKK